MSKEAALVEERNLPRGQRRIRGWFYIGAGLFVILLSFAGFGPSLIDHSRRFAPPTPLVIAHGISAFAWLLFFVWQATLVATRRVATHRRLGWVGPVLIMIIFVLGILMQIDGFHRDSDLSGDLRRLVTAPGAPPATEAENIAGFWQTFAVFFDFIMLVIVGLCFRHRPEVHKRLMTFALFPLAAESLVHLLGASVGRVPVSRGVIGVIGTVVGIVLVAGLGIRDKVSLGRIHPASIWIPILYLVWGIVLNVVVYRSAWAYSVAAWLVR